MNDIGNSLLFLSFMLSSVLISCGSSSNKVQKISKSGNDFNSEMNDPIIKTDTLHRDDAALKNVAEKIFSEEELQLSQMQKMLMVTVQRKNFLEGEFKQNFTFRINIINNSTRDIRSFVGVLRFTMAEGKIKNIPIAFDQGISAGSTISEKFTSPFDALKEEDQMLRALDLAAIKVEWLPSNIVFAE